MAPRLVNFLILAIMLVGMLDALTGCAGNAVAPSPSASAPAPGIPGGATPAGLFKICKAQTYALCATASCTVINQVAYCKCDVKEGDSISLPLRVDGEDVCSINANGVDNGYMVSTFSLPESVVAPNGHRALYTCPAGSTGGYAQCDGGICFTSSNGSSFPGFDRQLGSTDIICACPITQAQGSPVGYQIAGPYPCADSYFRYCNSQTANTSTGSTVKVGAPTGTAGFLALQLNGSVPKLNECRAPSQ
ncbi:conserved exported hypothetical protein [Paraburkholderia piptadeniae]|uniref:Secreted protein n=1 Tax=Paraburkholderia piptadeniae TaxID=1701573 RepID=A0A1N7STA9_9BURK|nr:hypothetical protein [Paraburkholderia piptadeniae]SIT50711.1 conserved exported hypothetical protein [Paraburkholderia piptadeniae]